MSEEKKLEEKKNKALVPGENKGETPPPAPPQIQKPNLERGAEVKIKFRQNRAAEGVAMDADGTATVDAKTADYLISIGYADTVKE